MLRAGLVRLVQQRIYAHVARSGNRGLAGWQLLAVEGGLVRCAHPEEHGQEAERDGGWTLAGEH